MKKLTFVWNDKEDELNLANPYSRIVCFVLYLYSLEFGTPPLYAELNRVTREMDTSQLKTLGPIALVLWIITSYAEESRAPGDKIESGRDIYSRVSYNLAGLALFFRGA